MSTTHFTVTEASCDEDLAFAPESFCATSNLSILFDAEDVRNPTFDEFEATWTISNMRSIICSSSPSQLIQDLQFMEFQLGRKVSKTYENVFFKLMQASMCKLQAGFL
jgi:hypothetical protein